MRRSCLRDEHLEVDGVVVPGVAGGEHSEVADVGPLRRQVGGPAGDAYRVGECRADERRHATRSARAGVPRSPEAADGRARHDAVLMIQADREMVDIVLHLGVGATGARAYAHPPAIRPVRERRLGRSVHGSITSQGARTGLVARNLDVTRSVIAPRRR
jgi:hypothetical protein